MIVCSAGVNHLASIRRRNLRLLEGLDRRPSDAHSVQGLQCDSVSLDLSVQTTTLECFYVVPKAAHESRLTALEKASRVSRSRVLYQRSCLEEQCFPDKGSLISYLSGQLLCLYPPWLYDCFKFRNLVKFSLTIQTIVTKLSF